MSFDQMPRTPHSLTLLKRGCGDNWNCVYSSGAGFPPSTVSPNSKRQDAGNTSRDPPTGVTSRDPPTGVGRLFQTAFCDG